MQNETDLDEKSAAGNIGRNLFISVFVIACSYNVEGFMKKNIGLSWFET